MQDMFVTYALKSINDNFIYVGITNNLERRFGEHNAGRNYSTKKHKPYKIIYAHKFYLRAEARKFEKKMKSGYGKEFLRTLVENKNNIY